MKKCRSQESLFWILCSKDYLQITYLSLFSYCLPKTRLFNCLFTSWICLHFTGPSVLEMILIIMVLFSSAFPFKRFDIKITNCSLAICSLSPDDFPVRSILFILWYNRTVIFSGNGSCIYVYNEKKSKEHVLKMTNN